MDKEISSALQINEILNLIQPVSDSGKYHKHHLTKWKPGQEASLSSEYKHLEKLQKAVSSYKNLTGQLSNALSEVPYLPQTLNAIQSRTLLMHECFELKKLVHYAIQIQQIIKKHKLEKLYPLPELESLYDLLDPEQTKSPSFTLSAAFDQKLALNLVQMQELQLRKRHVEHKLMQSAQKALGLDKLIAEIVVSRQQKDMIKKLSNSGFYITVDENFANMTFQLKETKQLTDIKQQISKLSSKLSGIEDKVLKNLSQQLKNYHPLLIETSELLQRLDWDLARVKFSIKYNCCIPGISKMVKISAQQAVNLPVMLIQTEQSRKYQPLNLDFSSPLNILTGPNMGGKTTALITVGQLCLLAHYAIPIPAKEAQLCLFDNIWFNQEPEKGESLSSFGREIVSLATALNKKGRTLYLFDELAKGTNPLEGEAILTAVLNNLSEQPALVLAATHYDIANKVKTVSQYAIKGIASASLNKLVVDKNNSLNSQLDLINLLIDYSLVKLSDSIKPPQNAISIAEILGLPDKIISEAKTIMRNLV